MVERYDPASHDENGESLLAHCRKRRGVTQEEMAAAVGVSIRTYRRLEQGKIDDPGVRILHNCALALGVSLYEILPAEWQRWTVFKKKTSGAAETAAEPPKWEAFFHPERPGSDGDLTVNPPGGWAEDEAEWMSERWAALDELEESIETKRANGRS